jgi:hypothetical protein
MRNNATAQQNKAPFGKLCFALLCLALYFSWPFFLYFLLTLLLVRKIQEEKSIGAI